MKTNRAFDRETGLEADELIGKKVSEIFVPSEAAYLIEVFGQVARTGEPIHYEYYSKERDRYFDVSIFSHKKGQCATTFFDISDKKKNEKALKRQLEELNILQAISSISIEVLDEYELIEKITKLLAEKIYSDHIGVLLLDHKKGELYLNPSYRGVSDEDLKLRIKLGQGITGQVAASGKPLRIDDAKERRDYLPNSNPSLRSEVCVPIRNKERIIGVINAEAVKVGAFSEQDERLLSTIADLLATSIERVRWFQAERRQKLEAEAQREATTALVGVFEPDQVLERIVSSLEKVVQFSCAKNFSQRRRSA